MRLTKLLEKGTYYCVFLACLLLFVKTTLSNFALILLLALSFVSLIYAGARIEFLKSAKFYLGTTLMLFVPIVIGTFYAPSMADAFFQWNKSLFYLLLPIILLRRDLQQSQLLLWATRGVITGAVLSMTVLLLVNTFNFINSNLPLDKLLSYHFTGKSFLSLIPEMHPVYFGSYVVLMVVLLWRRSFRINGVLRWMISLLAIFTVVFLNSRILFLIALLILVVLLFNKLRLKNVLLVLGGFLLLAGLSYPLVKETYLFNKLVSGTYWELTENISEPNTDADNRADSRMSRWKVSLELFGERPLFGHGTGSSRKLLVDRYKANNMEASVAQGYDSHNQYLGYGIEYGLMGLVFILTFLFFNIYRAINSTNVTSLLFYLMVAVICLTENYLIRNMGINLVALFGAIFCFSHHD